MRLALDPAALAWALHPRGAAARAALLAHDSLLPAPAVPRLRALRPRLTGETGLAPGELWDLVEALLARVRAVPPEAYAEFLPVAARLVPPPCAPTLALALAMEVDALLAGGPGFEGQDLVRVVAAWPAPRQRALPRGDGS